jgi:hypothetical protein
MSAPNAVDSELYSDSTTEWVRVRKPRSIRPIPLRAEFIMGWYCKQFVDDSGHMFERRRRRGQSGIMERWFLLVSFQLAKHETQVEGDRIESPKYAPHGREVVECCLEDMLRDVIEEVDFAAKSFSDAKCLSRLHRIQKHVFEASRIVRNLEEIVIAAPSAVCD